MTVIAMTREMGTLGKDVALGLSVDMGMSIIHHQLVEEGLAKRLNLDAGDVHRFLEGSPSLLESWKIDEKRLSSYSAEEILNVARNGNVLIRGWGATHLLRDVTHVLRVRICSTMPFRVKEMMKRLGVDDAAVARKEIERNDAAHTRTMQQFDNADWRDPVNYHLVLNTALMPTATCVALIRDLAGDLRFKPTEESKAVLTDKLVEARVRAAVDSSENAELSSRSLDIKVKDGAVTLTGIAPSRSVKTEAGELVGALPGVTRVENNIVHVDTSHFG